MIHITISEIILPRNGIDPVSLKLCMYLPNNLLSNNHEYKRSELLT